MVKKIFLLTISSVFVSGVAFTNVSSELHASFWGGTSSKNSNVYSELHVSIALWNVTKNIGQPLINPEVVQFFGPGACEKGNLNPITSDYHGNSNYVLQIRNLGFGERKYCATHPKYGSITIDHQAPGRRQGFTFPYYE